jgi:LuxR family maltose regulon positive regulatory protein
LPSRAAVAPKSPLSPIDPARPEAAAPSAVEIWRAALVNRLRAARSLPVASIVAPAGYGKTTLLTQWAARDERSFAFVPLDEPETDAATLVLRVADAVGRITAVDIGRGACDRSEAWIWGTALPRLGSALLAAELPFVLVLDDAHLLAADGAEVVTALVPHVPPGSMIVLAARMRPVASIPRLRASGDLLELEAEDLALTRRETRALFQEIGVTVSEDTLVELLRTTEGWVAGLRSAAVSLRERHTLPGAYFHEEFLAGLGPGQREFLRRTSILDRMCGPVCDALLERHDSARSLAALEATGLFVVPLDRSRVWFRYHRAFREQLRAELEEEEPWLVPLLARRAAEWFEANGAPEDALLHANAAGDADTVARILDDIALLMHDSGRDTALLAWIARLEASGELAGHPRLAALAARLHAQSGDAAGAERCLADATRALPRRSGDGGAKADPRIALARAAMCAEGVERMLADVESALDDVPGDDRWRPYGLLLQGSAYALLGEAERADAILSRAAHAAERLDSTESRMLALTQRSLLAAARGDRGDADALLAAALDTMNAATLNGYPTSALTLAVSARSLLLHGHVREAGSALATARRLSAGLTNGLPWLAVQTRLELAGAYVTLRDSVDAVVVLAEVDELVAACPELGILPRRLKRLATEIDAMPSSGSGRTVGLTAAELRLLPLLATHLSFREIGLRFFLSRNTVKTQAISVYRKLGASSRSEAVDQAQRLNLIGPGADTEGVIPTG